MKNYIISLVAFMAAALSAPAASLGYDYSLIINKLDGTQVEYKFEVMPVATIDGDDLCISTDADPTKVRYPIAELNNLTFRSEVNAGVNDLSADTAPRVSFIVNRQSLEAEGLPAGAMLTVYAANGTLAAQCRANASGAVSINISHLGHGIYIVKAADHSFKFIR